MTIACKIKSRNVECRNVQKIVGIGLPQGSPPSFFPVKGVCKLRPHCRAPPVAGMGQTSMDSYWMDNPTD